MNLQMDDAIIGRPMLTGNIMALLTTKNLQDICIVPSFVIGRFNAIPAKYIGKLELLEELL